ncbi:hypothetical protein BDW59DRAFT_146720 [Aspergillus cavernicola]|uniref:Uncharacterized protein n=1 Tax=Aspergillus cavernicola TaxID=176166 RepID=A0ABR4IBB2_9EURO
MLVSPMPHAWACCRLGHEALSLRPTRPVHQPNPCPVQTRQSWIVVSTIIPNIQRRRSQGEVLAAHPHPHLQLVPLCQSIPCLMQARSRISNAGRGEVGGASMSSTGLSEPANSLSDAARSRISDTQSRGQVSGASAFSTGLSASSIPWLTQARS